MDSGDNKIGQRQEDKLRVDFLDRFEIYQIMASVFFKRLTKDEKIDALLEVIDLMKPPPKE